MFLYSSFLENNQSQTVKDLQGKGTEVEGGVSPQHCLVCGGVSLRGAGATGFKVLGK